MRIISRMILSLLIIVVIVGSMFACDSESSTQSPATESVITEPASTAGNIVDPMPGKERLKVATTTSLYDSGLWGYIEPMFEEEYGVELDVIYAGTGIALEYGRRGDVDIITVHSRAREDQFVDEGYGLNRRCFAFNYFLIVGPGDDPAGIKGLSPTEAFTKLKSEGEAGSDTVKFISRGDDSGTHGKEKNIWAEAGYDYAEIQESGDWYVEVGRGMGPTLLMASEMQGYTLTDKGTYLSYKGDLELAPIVEEGDILLNVYSAIAVNQERHSKSNFEMANNLINFLISDDIQELIGNYGVESYGMQLFTPCGGGGCQDIGCPTWEECAKPAQ